MCGRIECGRCGTRVRLGAAKLPVGVMLTVHLMRDYGHLELRQRMARRERRKTAIGKCTTPELCAVRGGYMFSI